MRQSTAQRPWRPTAGGLRAAGALRAAAVLAAAGLVLTACTDPDDGGPEAVEPHPEVAARPWRRH